MYACMYVCTYVCVCVYVCMHVCAYSTSLDAITSKSGYRCVKGCSHIFHSPQLAVLLHLVVWVCVKREGVPAGRVRKDADSTGGGLGTSDVDQS